MQAGVLGLVGQTPMIRLVRITEGCNAEIWVKIEGQNPAGSVKDRAAWSMINRALERGEIQPGDRLIEATSGNTGIALAMVAACVGLHLTLIMPDNQTVERRDAMRAYGAELILVPAVDGMEGARDLARRKAAEGYGRVLDQFNNPDNPRAHYETTGPEIWQQSSGRVTHFISSMGTTGTIMGVSRFLKEQNPDIQVVGLQPAPGSQIAGIRRWPEAYLPGIFEPTRVDQVWDVSEVDAKDTMRQLARDEGICCGVSSGAAVFASLRLATQIKQGVIVAILCDRGDRYLSTGIFGAASS
ncbi:MAG: cysteine synthase CysM [Pseudomonadales bacterium]|nr:cysteine synthase CysM [Pseudomonadales bacterium]